MFFDLRRTYPHLIGFKEFGGAKPLTYAAEHIGGASPDIVLMVGVDTQVFHGFVNCGAVGAITGIGNVLPKEVLHLVALCERAAGGTQRQGAGRRNSTRHSACCPPSTKGPIWSSTTST